jgi:tyrosinase
MSKPTQDLDILSSPSRIRKDIVDLSKEELDKLIYAWTGIQENPPDPDTQPDDPNTMSFFNIAAFHGEPFRGAGYSNSGWWGGYCNHGNVLFPTWHRAYLLCLENALRSISYCKDVTLPFWNQVIVENTDKPIPEIFLQKKYTYQTDAIPGMKDPITGTRSTVRNPLYSYQLQRAVFDRLSSIPDADYSKPYKYETVRYPFSGLVSTDEIKATSTHNQTMNDLGEKKINELLQQNVSNWLIGTVTNSEGKKIGANTRAKYIRSLSAPNYTVYSNTTSAQRWNDDRFEGSEVGSTAKTDGDKNAVVSGESPHNAIHLAVGGFHVPGISNYSHIPGANGDMGENNTAAFDPIFFFHHCFIDLMFWAWQVHHGKEHELDIITAYPGTNSVDNQGPTPGIPGNTWLGLDTTLNPFTNHILPRVRKRLLEDIFALKEHHGDRSGDHHEDRSEDTRGEYSGDTHEDRSTDYPGNVGPPHGIRLPTDPPTDASYGPLRIPSAKPLTSRVSSISLFLLLVSLQKGILVFSAD